MVAINFLCEKIKQLYNKGALHILCGTFATKFVTFFGSIVVVRILSKEEYGLLGYIENIYSYALIIAGMGLSNAALRYVVISPPERKRYFQEYIVSHSMIRNIIITGFIIVVNFFIDYPDNFKEAKLWIPVFALLIPLQDCVNDSLYSLRALFLNKKYAFFSVLVSSILIIGRIVGAYGCGIKGVAWSGVIINMLFCILLVLYTFSLFPSKGKISLNRKEVREINIYSFQYMITNGLWAMFLLNDIFILGIFCNNPNIVADYKVAYVLPGNISIFANAIAVFVCPYFTKNEKNLSWIKDNYKKVYLVTTFVAILIVSFIIIFAKPLIQLLYGVQYINVIPLMRILLVAAFLNAGLRYITASILAAMGMIKYNMIISFIGILLQIFLDVILVQKFQEYGVAVSSCIVYGFMACTLFIIFYKKFYSKA
jgi:hypothetical protein